MAAHSSYFWSSLAFTTVYAPYCSVDSSGLHILPLVTAFTVCALYFSANGSALLILPLINGFRDGLHADFLSGWQYLVRSYARQWLLRFASRIAQQITADCQYLRSSSSFAIVRVLYYVADGSGLLIPALVNSFPNG